MYERKILQAALNDRSHWQSLTTLSRRDDWSPESGILWTAISEFYEADPSATATDPDLLKSKLERTLASNKLSTMLCSVLDDLKSSASTSSPVNLIGELRAMRRHQLGLKLSTKLASGGKDSEIEELIAQWQAEGGPSEESEICEITGVPVAGLLESVLSPSNLIKVFPKALNERLDGGLLPGHHLLIFARPEMGKTLVALNMVAGFLWQKLRILYVGNEDPAEDILLRLGTRLSGLNKYEIRDNPQGAQKLIDERAGDLFTIAPLAPGNFRQIDALVRKYSPRVVVLDQLRNIDVQSDNRTQALEKAATEARNLAKRRGVVVVSITQAGDSASGKRLLSMGDVDGSNTGIPAQCDVMVGVGADDLMIQQNLRMFSFPKNKRGGGRSHDPLTVQVDPLLSKVLEAA